jgi:hypothetical protein
VVLYFSEQLPVVVLKQNYNSSGSDSEPFPNIISSFDLAFANWNQQTEYLNNTG